jgi:hypothetical protein
MKNALNALSIDSLFTALVLGAGYDQMRATIVIDEKVCIAVSPYEENGLP